MRTCDACLDGRHRRCMGMDGCACSVCAARPRPKAKPVPRERKPAAPAKPKVKRTPRPEGERKRGRPRIYQGTVQERRAAGMRWARGRPTVADIMATPEYAAEVERLTKIIHG